LRHRTYILVAALGILSACSDSPTANDIGVSGSVSFNYTGAGGGAYNATGAITATASQQTIFTTDWATGFKEDASTSTNVEANVAQAGGVGNLFFLTVGRQTVGSSDIPVTCTTDNPACTDILFVVGGAQSGNFQFFCRLESGTVTVTAISANNAQGTFAGSGTCVTGGATQTESPFAITSGSFNVPLVVTPPNV
jgi:hypothetical protein